MRLHFQSFCIFLFGFVGLCSCATSTFSVRSTPAGAEVSVRKGEAAPTKLGATPLTLNRDNASEWLGDNFEVIVSKDGYAPQRVLMPKTSLGSVSSLDLTLQETHLPASCSEQDKTLNELAHGIAEAQYLLIKRNVDEAKRKLQDLSGRFPSVATVYTLLGSAHYMQKDFQKALEAYRHSNQLEPDNPETNRMIGKLKQVTGDHDGKEDR